MGVEVRYNLRSMKAEYKKGADKWIRSTDRKQADLRLEIADRFSYIAQQGDKGSQVWQRHVG